jgi:hypothetical protein
MNRPLHQNLSASEDQTGADRTHSDHPLICAPCRREEGRVRSFSHPDNNPLTSGKDTSGCRPSQAEQEGGIHKPVPSGRSDHALGGTTDGRAIRELRQPQAARLHRWLWMHQFAPYATSDEVRFVSRDFLPLSHCSVGDRTCTGTWVDGNTYSDLVRVGFSCESFGV